MKRLIVILLFLIPIIVIANDSIVQELVDLGEKLKGTELPGVAGKIFGNQRINLHIKQENGDEAVAGIIIKDSIFKEITSESLEKATMNMYTDEKVIRKIIKSDQPLQDLVNAIENGDIKYKAVGIFNKIKFGIISIFSKIFTRAHQPAAEQNETEAINESEEVIEQRTYKLMYTDWPIPSNVFSIYLYDFETNIETSLVSQYVGNKPLWSPDGERILYTGARTAFDISSVYILELNSSSRRIAIGFDASWFPNNEKIAYTKRENTGIDNFSIYVIDANSPDIGWRVSDDTNINKTFIWSGFYPKVSPNNRKILFYNDSDLYIANSDGSEVRKIAENISADDFLWSPNGEKIAFRRYVNAFNYTLHVINADGSNEINLGQSMYNGFYWSPDSTSILHQKAGRYNRMHLFITPINGGSEIELGEVSFDLELDWHPSGNRFAYSKPYSGSIGKIAVVNADGSNETELCDGEYPKWSPNGEKISYLKRFYDSSTNYREQNAITIYAANADCSGEIQIASPRKNILWQPR